VPKDVADGPPLGQTLGKDLDRCKMARSLSSAGLGAMPTPFSIT